MEVMLQEKDNFKRFEGGRDSTDRRTDMCRQADKQTDRQELTDMYSKTTSSMEVWEGGTQQTDRETCADRQKDRQTDML